jgi:hypothetical protein
MGLQEDCLLGPQMENTWGHKGIVYYLVHIGRGFDPASLGGPLHPFADGRNHAS